MKTETQPDIQSEQQQQQQQLQPQQNNKTLILGGIAVLAIWKWKEISNYLGISSITGSSSGTANYADQSAVGADNMAMISTLHPKIRSKAIAFIKECNNNNFDVTIFSAYWDRNTHEENARKGNTNDDYLGAIHNYGLAFDLFIGTEEPSPQGSKELDAVRRIGNRHGFESGIDHGSYIDNYHFEMTFGHNIHSLRRKYQNGDVYNGYVNI